MTIKDLKVGEKGIITSVNGDGPLRQHFLDMGMIPGAEVTIIKFAPMGDPVEVRIHGYELTLRLSEAAKIDIEKSVPEEAPAREEASGEEQAGRETSHSDTLHPGLGEGGKFHPKGSGNPLPEGTTLRFALVGNQNSGKTTLFNQLTGAKQHVGNFPGVTVDKKTGEIRGHADTEITDLPGIYSMSPNSKEEVVSRNFVLDEKPHAIINIVDATNIERNLYLTMQLLETGIPIVVALNMMDELAGNGGTVDINMMESMLGVPVVPISAAKNEGIDELVEHAIHVATYQEGPSRQDFCSEEDHGGAVHRCIHAVIHLIDDHAKAAGLPTRFAASKIIEGDEQILSRLKLDENEIETLRHITVQMENERGLDRNAAIADMRFSYIMKVCKASVFKAPKSAEYERSSRIDRILTGKFTAIPMFILVMAVIFHLTFNVIGKFFQDLLETGIGALTESADAMLTAWDVNPAVHGLIIEGIFEGVGSVLSFIPIIITMFFFLSLLEDSGYIARVAFVMDKLLRKLGLSGRSIVPMLLGFGCTVPAVMATRTLPSERDRRMTILLTPFMSCTAKLPIYAFFVSAFFPAHGGLVMTGLYLLGILTGIVIALIYKKTIFKGEAVPFVMELPNYRMPSARNVAQLLWMKTRDFIQRAFTIILVATMVVWFLKTFDFHLDMVTDAEDSILCVISKTLEPIFAPAGLGDWRIITSLISGFMAKESVVSVMKVLFAGSGGVAAAITPLTAASMLVFSVLYTPCVAAIGSIKRELGNKWALYVVIWQIVVAWAASLLVQIIGKLIGF